MSTELLAGLAAFALVTLFTPGPNNLMLLASGLNFGFRRALPHLIGVPTGFAAMVLIVGLGLGAVFAAYPLAHTVIKYVGGAYLLYLAWKIANAGPVDATKGERSQPMTFLQAVAFQWVNPKAWVMAVGGVATYAAITGFPFNMMLIASVFGTFGLVSSSTWVMFGSGLRRVIRDARAVRVLNVVMALALAASLIPVFTGDFG